MDRWTVAYLTMLLPFAFNAASSFCFSPAACPGQHLHHTLPIPGGPSLPSVGSVKVMDHSLDLGSAVRDGNLEVVRLLLQGLPTDPCIGASLKWSVRYSSPSVVLVRLLLENLPAGSDYIGASLKWSVRAVSPRLDIVQLLLEEQPGIAYIRNSVYIASRGVSPLDLVKLLLGFLPAGDECIRISLFSAVRDGSPPMDLVIFLLENLPAWDPPCIVECLNWAVRAVSPRLDVVRLRPKKHFVIDGSSGIIESC